MPKHATAPISPQRAFWALAAGLTLSWIGWQVMIVGATYMGRDWTETAYLVLFGALLIMYALRLRARLKATDSLPAREPMQLFYAASLIVLPVLTYLLRRHVLSGKLYGAPIQLIYLSGLISLLYVIILLLALLLDSEQYPRAAPEAWSRRLLRALRKWRHRRAD